jgi:hypothetical protein
MSITVIYHAMSQEKSFFYIVADNSIFILFQNPDNHIVCKIVMTLTGKPQNSYLKIPIIQINIKHDKGN